VLGSFGKLGEMVGEHSVTLLRRLRQRFARGTPLTRGLSMKIMYRGYHRIPPRSDLKHNKQARHGTATEKSQ
jgi:hypothetical protein